MDRRYKELLPALFSEYKKLGGLHSQDEYIRFLDILLGITGYSSPDERHKFLDSNVFGELISSDKSFNFWVDYVGSIKEAKIYIKSVCNSLEEK